MDDETAEMYEIIKDETDYPEAGNFADAANITTTLTENIDTLIQEIEELLTLTNIRHAFTSTDIQNRMLDMHNTATKIAPKTPKAPHEQN
tara:strand:- start:216 stop:485 length:270 start_codon:yes stop_codon:yes gene_type:complete